MGEGCVVSSIKANWDKMDEESAPSAKRRWPITRALAGDIVQFVDFVLVIGASVLVALIYHDYILISAYEVDHYLAAGIIGGTALTAMLRRDGYYEFDVLIARRTNLRPVISRWGTVAFMLLAFGFALKYSEQFSRFWFFAWCAVVPVWVVTSRAIAAKLLRGLRSRTGAFTRRIAVVGNTGAGTRFREFIRETQEGVEVVGLFCAGAQKEDGSAGDLSDLLRRARAGEIDDVVIALPQMNKPDLDRLASQLATLPVSVSICPNEMWFGHQGGEVVDLAGVSVLALYRRPLESWGGILKSMEDFVLGALLLLVASPILLLVAIAVRLDSKGPIFFRQKRHGFNNAVFRIYKFRTMTVMEDGDTVTQAKRGDQRVTRIGAFLRRYSLDELPQLINVVEGDMSLVGPRPHAMAHNHQYAKLIENYSGRHKVKPGITGWAQVNGLRGETSENEMMEERVRFDLAYVDNWSLWFDLKILFLTIRAVLFPKNAF